MKGKTLGLTILMGMLCTVYSIQLTQAQSWTRYALEEGGVVEDIQLLRRADANSLADTVWAANMENGLFRATYTGGTATGWSEWTEYLPNYGVLGVDAILVGSIEYVLAATTGAGLWYDSTTIPQGAWIRPHGDNYYPSTWHWKRTQDVAFFCNTDGTYPSMPETTIFVMLNSPVTEANPDQNPGIYRWTGVQSPDNYFKRVDATYNNDDARSFSHFYRDESDPNVLYAVLHAKKEGSPIYRGALYKFSGSYTQTSPSFHQVNIITTSGDVLLDVLGLNQWTSGGTTYSYVLVCWSDNGDTTYSVFLSTNLASSNYSFGTPPLYTLQGTDGEDLFEYTPDEPPFTREGLTANKVVGRPYGDSHLLFLATGLRYGMGYVDLNVGPDIEFINGSGSTELKRYENRAMIPDKPSRLGGDKMVLFFGTHKHGPWYLRFSSADIPTWRHIDVGFKAGDVRSDLKIISGPYSPPSYLLAGVWNTGVFEYCNSQNFWDWYGHGYSNPTYQSDPAFNKGIQSVAYFGTAGNYYYFGSGLATVTPGGLGTTDYTLGGLYKINYNQEASQDSFMWYSQARQDSFCVYNLVNATQNGTPYLYLTTGIIGPDDHFGPGEYHYICRKCGNTWTTLCSLGTGSPDYTDLAVTDLEPCPTAPADSFYISLGNVFAWTNTDPVAVFKGRVERYAKNTQNQWEQRYSWEDTVEYSTVADVAVLNDLRYPGKEIVFWGTSKLSEQGGSATAGPLKGMVYKRCWNGSAYTNASLYGTSSPWLDGIHFANPPAVSRLAAFSVGNQPVLVAVLVGNDFSDGAPIGYLYTYFGGTWHHYANPTINGNTVNMYAGDIQIDQPAGYDFIIAGAAGSVWRYDNGCVSSPMATSDWNWISFSDMNPEDSLKYLFAGADSLQEIRDQYGHRFKPNANPYVDEIGFWSWLKGYAVKTYLTDTLEVFGTPIPRDTTIVLYPAPQDSAWIYNYTGYWPTDTMNVNYAFIADSDTVIIVKQDDGNFWKPRDGDDFYLRPGEGYQVGVSDTMTYQYPEPQQGQSVGPIVKLEGGCTQSLTPEHFQFTTKTGDFYPIYIEDLLVNGQPPQSGDEVGCFTPAGLCVGAAAYDGEFSLKIAAWKDDPCTEEVDGYTVGQTLAFKFFDVSAGVEVPLEMILVATQALDPAQCHAYTRFEQGYYAEHCLQASYVLPMCYNLAQNYPNPFNPTTTIRYDLPFESNVHLDIFDLMGRKMATLVDGKQSAGFRVMYWKGTNNYGAQVASGVYFYRLKTEATHEYLGKTESYEKTRKMVMIK